MPFITGGDWSVALNSHTSLRQAEMLNLLGRAAATCLAPQNSILQRRDYGAEMWAR